MFLEHQIIILELFLKDRMTLETGVMVDENKYDFKIYYNRS